MYVIRSNTKQAKEERADSYDARAHLDESIYECPHWRYYEQLVRKIKTLSEVRIPE